MQFPASFKHDAAARDYLAWLMHALRDYPVAVELRHKTWSDDVGDTLQVLNTSRAAWVQIDEPKFRLSIAQNYLPNVEGFYYLRLHGRNAEGVVEPREIGRPLRLSVLGRGARPVRRRSRRRSRCS